MLTDRDCLPGEETGAKSTENEKDESSDTSTNNRPSKPVSMCEVCVGDPSKYTCPGCGMKTCSLPCVKEHKLKLNCDGERNKFAWVDKSLYSDRHLLNDYRFLENAERSLYSNKMVPKNRRMSDLYHAMPYNCHNQSRRSKILMTAAIKRGIRLRIMPNNLARHKANTSFYTIKSDVIDWHIEWHFVPSNCLVKDAKVPETTMLLDAVKKFGNAVDFPHLRKPLEDYRKSFHSCRYLIKVEGLPANRKRFVEMKPTSTIADNLKGLSLVEHPTFFVLPPSYQGDDFPLLDKDEDMPHLHPAHMRHLTNHHPDLSQTKCLEKQMLDPGSSLYKADEVIDVDAIAVSSSLQKAEEVVRVDPVQVFRKQMKSLISENAGSNHGRADEVIDVDSSDSGLRKVDDAIDVNDEEK